MERLEEWNGTERFPLMESIEQELMIREAIAESQASPLTPDESSRLADRLRLVTWKTVHNIETPTPEARELLATLARRGLLLNYSPE